jgi:hypothetical protein
MRADPAFRIGRPRQVYQGATERQWVPIEKRGEGPPSRLARRHARLPAGT